LFSLYFRYYTQTLRWPLGPIVFVWLADTSEIFLSETTKSIWLLCGIRMILKWSSTKLLILVLIWNPRWLPIRYNIGSYGSYSWLFETTLQACIMFMHNITQLCECFPRRSHLHVFPIGSYVKLCSVVVAILEIRMSPKYKIL
jgi:hypothetical protein